MITIDKEYLSDLKSRLESFTDKISYVNDMYHKLEILYEIEKNGVDDLKINFTGKYGRSSCGSRPEFGTKYGESTGIPKKLLSDMISFYESSIKKQMEVLEGLTIVCTGKM